MRYIAILIAILVLPVTALAETQFYYFDNGSGTESFDDHSEDIEVISPQAYYVGWDFSVHTTDDDDIINDAKRQDMKIVPLVFQQSFDRQLMSYIAQYDFVQQWIILQLIEEAEEEGYAGWQFDFENIAPNDRAGYTRFVERAAEMFEDEGLELSVAVVPRSTPYNAASAYQDWSSAYDYRELAEHADYLVAMAYDDGNSFGPAGSLPFQRAILNYMTTQVSPDKLQLGIPLYCWKWRITGGYERFGSLSHTDTDEDIEDGELLLEGYLEGLESEYAAYTVPSGNLYLTWCDGVRGFQAKQDLAEEFDLRGMSFWALGQEDDGFWRAL